MTPKHFFVLGTSLIIFASIIISCPNPHNPVPLGALTVVYDGNGNTSGSAPVDTNKYLEGTTVIIAGPGSISKAGSTFSGWSHNTDGNGDIHSPGDFILIGSGALTLYAKWTPNDNTIVFNTNGGSGSMNPQVLPSGSTANLFSNSFTRSGWTFAGWSDSPAGSVVYMDQESFTMDIIGITLYAVWTPNEYKVVFHSNSGIGSMDEQSVLCGTSATLTENSFTRNGWSFAGWATKADGPVVYYNRSEFIMGPSDLDLYAKWTGNPFTITFYPNGGTGVTTQQVIICGSTSSLRYNNFVREEWSFAGWSTTPDGSVNYSNGASFMMGPMDVTLYAKWVGNPHTITFNSNGGSGSMSSQVIPYTNSANLKANTFSRTGYSFAGWATTSDGSVAYSNGEIYTMGTQNVILYAKWTGNPYSISFDANGGSGSMSSQVIACGTSANLVPNSFVKVGYSFAGWATSSTSAISYSDGSSYTMGAFNRILYAKWSANNYLVTFDPNGGSGLMFSMQIPCNATYNLSSNTFTRTGWSFDGWATSPEGPTVYNNNSSITMGATDLTLYAKWKGNSYYVIYKSNGGVGSMPLQSLVCGSTSNLISNAFSKIGYSFAGWSTTASGPVIYSDGDSLIMTPGNLNLYAIWTANNYYVIYNGNGGEGTMPPRLVACDSTFQLDPVNYTKYENVFFKWSIGPNLTTTYNDNATITMGAADLNLYAHWMPNKYNVIYNSNGGTGYMPPKPMAYGTTDTLNPIFFQREGYTFKGWATSPDGEVAYANNGLFTMSVSDVTLYALWKSDFCTISFASNGGQGSMPTQTVRRITHTQLIPCEFNRPGYYFGGWAENSEGPATRYDMGSYGYTNLEAVTLYAIWLDQPLTVSFHPNGGNGIMLPQEIACGYTASLKPNSYSKDGYKFIGWSQDPDYNSNSSYDSFPDRYNYLMRTTSVLFYAIWRLE